MTGQQYQLPAARYLLDVDPRRRLRFFVIGLRGIAFDAYDLVDEGTDTGDELLPPGRRAVYEKGRALVQDLFRSLPDREPMRILHGDFHGWNVKINHGKISVFDFEDMVWGWPVQDIGVALYYHWERPDFEVKLEDFRS